MEPYSSPIWVRRVEALKSGKGLLKLQFFNACYAEGVQDFEVTLRVLARRYHFMMAAIDGHEERSALLCEVSFPWIEKHCAHLLKWRPPRDAPTSAQSDVSAWLEYAFGGP